MSSEGKGEGNGNGISSARPTTPASLGPFAATQGLSVGQRAGFAAERRGVGAVGLYWRQWNGCNWRWNGLEVGGLDCGRICGYAGAIKRLNGMMSHLPSEGGHLLFGLFRFGWL